MREQLFKAPRAPHVGYAGVHEMTWWVPALDPAPAQGSLSRGRGHGNPIAAWSLPRMVLR